MIIYMFVKRKPWKYWSDYENSYIDKRFLKNTRLILL